MSLILELSDVYYLWIKGDYTYQVRNNNGKEGVKQDKHWGSIFLHIFIKLVELSLDEAYQNFWLDASLYSLKNIKLLS